MKHHLNSLIVAAALAAVTFAMPANPCTTGWSDSVKQTSFKCTDASVRDWTLRHLTYAFIPAAIGLLVFVGCPFFYCGRYLCMCCGSFKVRPGYFCCGGSHWDGKPEEERFEAYTAQEVKTVKWGSVVILILPVMYFLGAYIGGGLLLSAIQDVINGALGLIAFVLNDTTKFVKNLQNPDGTYPSYFTSIGSQYNSTKSTLDDIQKDYIRNSIVDQLKAVVSGFAFPTFIPAAFMFLGAIMAVLRIRTCVPMLIAAFLFFLSLPFGCASSLFLIAAAPVGVICAEADAQLGRQPGIFQNYVIPNCDSVNPLAKLNDTVNSAIGNIANDACNQLYQICDNTAAYTPGSSVYWTCRPNMACSTTLDFLTLNASMQLKLGAPNPCGASAGTTCTVDQCQTQCTSSTAKSYSQLAMSDLGDLNRISTAVDNSEILTKYKTCDDFIDFVIHSIPLCDNGPAAFETLGGSFMLVVFGNMAGIVFMVLGSKRFIDRERYERGSNAAFGRGRHANLNAAVVVTRKTPATPAKEGGEEMSVLDASLL